MPKINSTRAKLATAKCCGHPLVAVSKGHKACFFKTTPSPRDDDAFYMETAVANGRLEMVEFLHKNRFTWNQHTFFKMLGMEDPRIVDFAVQNLCPIDYTKTVKVCLESTTPRSMECLEIVLRHLIAVKDVHMIKGGFIDLAVRKNNLPAIALAASLGFKIKNSTRQRSMDLSPLSCCLLILFYKPILHVGRDVIPDHRYVRKYLKHFLGFAQEHTRMLQ